MFLYFFTAVQDGPEFTDIIENITVPAGRNVKLACSVKNLGPFKVSSHEHNYTQRKGNQLNFKRL